ncbi:hypothetical protein SAY86_019782 [Trapa natans]|uniref:Uncharacterized protein n=1 Tax=Trapa natans TaxID=22666 RepID=A0AAN7R742_TRANT|nr:hypothetical protein SAY86_019782 [Trapa natans]
MAAQTNGHPAEPDPKEVGNAFIKQYYHMLINSPDVVHKFYHEDSKVSRPGPDGEMTYITTIKGINEKIMSLNYDKYKVEIITADSQASYKGGVSLLVTGVLTGEDGTRMMYSQSFFLAPQEPGYYVLNDIFRYLEGTSAAPVTVLTSVEIAEAPEAGETPEPEVCENHVVESVPVKEVSYNGDEDSSSMEDAKDPVVVEEALVETPSDPSINDASCPTAVIPSVIQGDGTKKSFASIVSALKNNSAPFQWRALSVKVEEKPRAPAVAPEAPVHSVPSGIDVAERISGQTVKRHSIFVGNLPLDATEAMLEVAFKRFGPIKRNGIQVRSSKGSCYGFVEFESESSVRAALEGASILIGNRAAHIEEQKNDGDKRRAPQGRGTFRNDNFRGRGGSFRGRGYGRSDFGRRSEFSPWNTHNGALSKEQHYTGSGRMTPRHVVED